MNIQPPLIIDGSQGEGGGQIVRSSLSLSLVTGRDIVLENIRAGRKKGGLLRQHLTAVQAAAEISGASVEGNRLRSSKLVFRPDRLRGGAYSFRIGTAGSTTLVLQTILPALMIADAPSEVFLEGGTHNPTAPPFDFLSSAFLPLLERMGPKVKLTLDRYGFFPAGGGRVRAHVTPSSYIAPLQLLEGGKPSDYRVRALVAQLPEHIGERECETIARKLGWPERSCSVESIQNSDGPGNVVLVEVDRADVTEVFTGFGERGVQAEKVGAGVARKLRRYLKADVPVGEQLADQLLLPMGIAAHLFGSRSEYLTLELSAHTRTHIEVLQAFLEVHVETVAEGTDRVRVLVSPR